MPYWMVLNPEPTLYLYWFWSTYSGLFWTSDWNDAASSMLPIYRYMVLWNKPLHARNLLQEIRETEAASCRKNIGCYRCIGRRRRGNRFDSITTGWSGARQGFRQEPADRRSICYYRGSGCQIRPLGSPDKQTTMDWHLFINMAQLLSESIGEWHRRKHRTTLRMEDFDEEIDDR